MQDISPNIYVFHYFHKISVTEKTKNIAVFQDWFAVLKTKILVYSSKHYYL